MDLKVYKLCLLKIFLNVTNYCKNSLKLEFFLLSARMSVIYFTLNSNYNFFFLINEDISFIAFFILGFRADFLRLVVLFCQNILLI